MSVHQNKATLFVSLANLRKRMSAHIGRHGKCQVLRRLFRNVSPTVKYRFTARYLVCRQLTLAELLLLTLFNYGLNKVNNGSFRYDDIID